jgi:hypothetical protein
VADARKTTFASGRTFVARSVTGAIAAESATLSDANYDPAAGLDCFGYDTIFVGVEITAGTSPTITIEPLFRDSSDATDGARWFRIKCGVTEGVTPASAANLTTGALASNADFTELKVFGCRNVFLRASAVANATSTTAWKVLVMPGKVRDTTNLSRG